MTLLEKLEALEFEAQKQGQSIIDALIISLKHQTGVSVSMPPAPELVAKPVPGKPVPPAPLDPKVKQPIWQ